LIGAPVAVLIAILAWIAPESEAWKQRAAPSLSKIFTTVVRNPKIFFYLLVLMSAMLCLSHGTQDLYPDFLKSIPALARRTVLGMKMLYGIPILYNLAAIVGALVFGQLSERIGRRYAVMLALLVCLLSIPAWAFGSTLLMLVLGSCFMQMGGQGAFGVIPAHKTELSPDAVRGLFPGLVYQLGFLLASPATAVELFLRDRLGYAWALTTFETCVILVLLVLFAVGPEARGRSFVSSGAE
jgi:SHS family lactate transporter-like MFS transporter